MGWEGARIRWGGGRRGSSELGVTKLGGGCIGIIGCYHRQVGGKAEVGLDQQLCWTKASSLWHGAARGCSCLLGFRPPLKMASICADLLGLVQHCCGSVPAVPKLALDLVQAKPACLIQYKLGFSWQCLLWLDGGWWFTLVLIIGRDKGRSSYGSFCEIPFSSSSDKLTEIDMVWLKGGSQWIRFVSFVNSPL